MSKVLIAEKFDGHELPVFEVNGNPHWIAKQVGAALGYAGDGRELPQSITQKWSDEFVEGDDFLMLTGEKLRDFKELCSLGGGFPLSPNTPHLMLLTEEGIYNCAILSRKPAGRRLRKWLKSEVLPQIARSGNYLHAHSDDFKFRQLESYERVEMENLAVRRVEAETGREIAQARKFDAESNRIKAEAKRDQNERLNRKQEAEAYKMAARAMYDMGEISKVDLDAYFVHAAELLVGGRIEKMYAKDQSGPWKRAQDLAREWKTTKYKVGKSAVKLGLRGDKEGLVRTVVCRRANTTGSAITHEYSVKAQKMLKDDIFGVTQLGIFK